MLKIEKAKISDVEDIHNLIGKYAAKQKMLPRSRQSLYENIRSLFICRNQSGKVIGCVALHIVWEDLAEIRSLAVEARYGKKGLGKSLVEACLNEARSLGVGKVFALTYVPGFFKKFGFRIIKKEKLPHKIWTDCLQCAHFPNCQETALEIRLGRRAKR